MACINSSSSAAAALSLLRNCGSVRAMARIKSLRGGRGGASPVSFVPQTQRLFHLPLQFRRAISHVSATNDEEASARAAVDTGAPTIFDKIIAKEIPSTIVYEDEKVLAFRDINPQAPVHVLVIPKFRDGLTQLGKAEARHHDILGDLLYAAKIVAEKEGILDGFRVVINSGPTACQSVYHVHLHVLGGRQMNWPPG
ncbi:14 kDa zinc-binding protein-like [Diospyros lotus]|uniref:14 kDa zinc-binding protein-like n=1 Tax=Diospyros lotus TaxID=55363 RepID=UPI0022527398|nr:14 kDa zinc-binding protein-like [Diospyros lotus]